MGADYYWFCPQTKTGITGYKAEFIDGDFDSPADALAHLARAEQYPSTLRARSWLEGLPEGAKVRGITDYSFAGFFETPCEDEIILRGCDVLDVFRDDHWPEMRRGGS